MSDEVRLIDALEALAAAWNRLDPGVVEPLLSESIRYESFDTELMIDGRTAVLEHLRRKVELIEQVGADARIRAELGWITTSRGVRRPCVIAAQGDVERSALFMATLDARGQIERIVVSTQDPDPRSAIPRGRADS
jgi:hypothetical protein